jgi:hypothetical protein
MLHPPSPLYQRLHDRILKMPVIDCHEHLRGPEHDLPTLPREPIAALTVMYRISDLWSAGVTDAEIELLGWRSSSPPAGCTTTPIPSTGWARPTTHQRPRRVSRSRQQQTA